MGSIEDSSGVPQVWQRRSEGSGTSHNAFSGNFWGDGRSSFRRYLVDGMSHVRLRQQSGALELDRRSSELHRWSPELNQRSSELNRRSPELDRRSSELDRRSSELDQRSPDLHCRSSEPRASLPERGSSILRVRGSATRHQRRQPAGLNRRGITASPASARDRGCFRYK